ncbi:hypothetical protein [Achromobacter xylosoxidans]|uniref:hypothetical protein n=1 Tax=Alcaligenes xylosoxydans xylosoxydans TaxID=85698 RepID=UPI00105B242E|nr:hypothetical protein [Achromobacter xylosoxidans]
MQEQIDNSSTKPDVAVPESSKSTSERPASWTWKNYVFALIVLAGVFCTLFINILLGVLLYLAGWAFAKIVGLNRRN